MSELVEFWENRLPPIVGRLPAESYSLVEDPRNAGEDVDAPAQDRLRPLARIIETLQALARDFKVGPEEVRLVFGFDS